MLFVVFKHIYVFVFNTFDKVNILEKKITNRPHSVTTPNFGRTAIIQMCIFVHTLRRIMNHGNYDFAGGPTDAN